MSEEADKKLSPWHPIKDAVDLKYLGKLSEELGELIAAISRCIIQGIDECEPVTGIKNCHWLENEIADVMAGIELNIEYFNLNNDRINSRASDKMKRLREWHKMA